VNTIRHVRGGPKGRNIKLEKTVPKASKEAIKPKGTRRGKTYDMRPDLKKNCTNHEIPHREEETPVQHKSKNGSGTNEKKCLSTQA